MQTRAKGRLAILHHPHHPVYLLIVSMINPFYYALRISDYEGNFILSTLHLMPSPTKEEKKQQQQRRKLWRGSSCVALGKEKRRRIVDKWDGGKVAAWLITRFIPSFAGRGFMANNWTSINKHPLLLIPRRQLIGGGDAGDQKCRKTCTQSQN